MNEAQALLKNLKAEKQFFIGIDSDGCVFDTMEVKQKECFCPAFVNHFNLQAVAKYARQTWEFVNLYSQTRGVNRYIALVRALKLLGEREEVKIRGAKVPTLTKLERWIKEESKLGLDNLEKLVGQTGDEELTKVRDWSRDVNKAVDYIVRGVSPFPYVRDCLEIMNGKADNIVVSQTPVLNLEREWIEHNIQDFVKIIAGQEMGTKSEHIDMAAVGKYDADKILMIGDAPGDMKAAFNNKALFFPICPGDEENSWKSLKEEGLERFFNCSYAGSYQEKLLKQFESILPEEPNWERSHA